MKTTHVFAFVSLILGTGAVSAQGPDITPVATFIRPVPAAYDHFGGAVASVGDGMVLVGAQEDNTGASLSGAACLFRTDGALLTTFANPTPGENDNFGWSVMALGTDKVLISAPGDSTGAALTGAVYLFSTGGTLIKTFLNPTPAYFEVFGTSMAAVGTDRVLIGAADSTGTFTDSGAAYLFNADGTLLTTFPNPSPAQGDFFGSSVAAAGGARVVIGAPGDGTGMGGGGAAYLFHPDGPLVTTFTNPTPAEGDAFGVSVAAVDGNRVIISASGDDTGATNAGAVYLFRADGVLLTTFKNPSPAENDGFGSSVAVVGGNRVLVCATGDDTGGTNAGAAYLFSTEGTLLATYLNPAPALYANFGISAAAAGKDRMIIGALNINSVGGTGAGAAFLFALPAAAAGSLDPLFAPDVSGAYVSGIAPQPDGKTVLAGNYSTVNGQTRKGIARLLADGTVEPTATFNSGTGNNAWTTCAAVQGDGKIVIGGAFSTVNGQTRNRIARLNANGSVESTSTFNPGSGTNGQFSNGSVNSVALQPDGKILLAGQFTTANGQPRRGIARLLANGAVESTATFNPGTGAGAAAAGTDANVYGVAVQADGKILLAGDFIRFSGQPRRGIARLNANGTLESTATFNPGTGAEGSGGVTTEVYSVAVQADGRILLAGNFSTVNGQPRRGIARLNPDGTVDSTAAFNHGDAFGGFRTVALQADGRILVGGGAPGGSGVIRFQADGTVEDTATFNPNPGQEGYLAFGLALQADGKILLGGAFTSLGGQPRNHIARLSNDLATESLTVPDTTRVRWLRGGTSPEVEQVIFEVSGNGGTDWTLLGSGSRIVNGWELTGLSLPGSGSVRARGRTSGGGGTGLVESLAAIPLPPEPIKGILLKTFTGPAVGDDLFSTAMAAAGPNRMLIGAQAVKGGTGEAYLFNTGDGTLLTTFLNPAPADGLFGNAVAAVGNDKILIAAYLATINGKAGVGAAYLFSTDGTLLTTFKNPTEAEQSGFGLAVAAVETDKVLISAGDGPSAKFPGIAYLFSTDGTLLKTFHNPGPSDYESFGYSMAGVGPDKVLIGNPDDDTGAPNAGAAYLFSTDGALLKTFNKPAPAETANFGFSVAALGTDRVLIGAHLTASGAGAAYLFNIEGGLLTTFKKPPPVGSDYFGYSVAAVGTGRVLIGAAYEDSAGFTNSGSAYLFDAGGALLDKFSNPAPEVKSDFGFTVAAAGSDRVIIGTFGTPAGGPGAGSGAAYLFDLPYPPLTIARNGPVVSISWSTSETGLVLQQSDPPKPLSTWNDTRETVIISGVTNVLQQNISTGPASRFYRLHRP